MRVAAAVLVAIVAAGSPAFAAGEHTSNTGASNNGTSVDVRAGESNTTGGGGPGRSRGRGAPGVDWNARYSSLINAMSLEQLRETDRRSDEASEYRRLINVRDDCADKQAYHGARSLRWVLVTDRVAVRETVTVYDHIPYYVNVRVPVVVYEHIPTVEHYTVRVRRGWRWALERRTRVAWVVRPVTTWRIERRLQWRVEARAVARTVWRTVERWEQQGNAAHTVAAAISRACVNNYNHAINTHRAAVDQRRSEWNGHWSGRNRQAHEAWRHLNTTCQTVREVGTTDVQVCSYGQWRNFSPGSFDRTIVVPPAPPPRQVVNQARDRITPPGPTIRMSPRVEWEQIVQFPTWLWIEPAAWQPLTARADAGRAWAEATATPTRVVWDMGNGDQVVCAGPGSVFNEARPDASQRTGCSYTYRQSSSGQPNDAYTVTATLVYDVTWQGSGDAGGDLGTITQTNTASVRVAELQALITDAG